jgi:porin
VDGRDGDVLGVGYANGIFSNNASTTYTDDNEDVLEVYYNAQVTPWLNLSPMVQYVADPGGNDTAKDATVVGLRAQWTF